MDTERPDNDDATTGPGADGTAENARDVKGASGGTEARDPQEGPGLSDPGEPGARTGGLEAAAPGAGDREADADPSGARDGGGPPAEAPGAGEGGASDGGPPEAPPTRRRTSAMVAAVTAAVLLVGGGGAYLTARASGGPDGGTSSSGAPGGGGTPPPLVLDGSSETGANGIAPGEPDPYGAVYRAGGALPDGPGSAPVYRARGEVTRQEVARLAEALGLDGAPVAEGQVWKAGSGKDGQGPSLRVNRQAPGAWTFHRYAPGTDDCRKPTVCAQDPASPAGDPVSEEAAMKAAAPVLKAVGQDDARRDASQVVGARRTVNADPVVGGLPTYGWTTGVTVGGEGEVVGGSGQLGAPVKGDTYPVVSAGEALDLMNARPGDDPRAGVGGCASPVPLQDRREEPCEASADAPQQEPLTVEKAVFGLAAHVVEGRRALVPSWLFEVRAAGAGEAFTVTYPAVEPEYLAAPGPGGQPTGRPSPRPTGPGDEPTSAPAPRDVEVEGYTAEGNELTVTFSGGVCSDYEATAREGADRVTVTVTERPWPGKVCIMIAKQYQQTVRLDGPLGDREVVGSDGEPVPLQKDGARLPAPPERTR
ncbi:hypothetical protein [Streptomyces sp. NPDC052701]|uniref:hypothetical protein n=1 Tax=Streptomyces sp. NPDC052701 TaxID=3155533 RepID=UPI00341A1153